MRVPAQVQKQLEASRLLVAGLLRAPGPGEATSCGEEVAGTGHRAQASLGACPVKFP